MLFLQRTLITFLVTFMAASLFGCGEKTVTAPAGNKLEASQRCIDCHQGNSWNSPGTLEPIVAEWLKSTHKTSNGAGCADCHEPEAGHPESCHLCHGGIPAGIPGSTNHISRNPDTDGKCGKCHRKGSTWGTSLYDGAAVDIQFVHYSTGKHANYVATNYKNYCRKCHNPHDPTTAREMRQQWARSGHGDTVSGARTIIDFKVRGNSVPAKDTFSSICVRCHTSTGYISYVKSGFSDVRALPDSDGVRGDTAASPNPRTTYLDTSREATNCDVCHDDGRSGDGSAYSYKTRAVPQVFTYYNYSSTPLHQTVWDVKYQVTFPDLGVSNICVVCHSGREIGLIIKIASARGMDFSNQSRISAHDRVAASTMYGQSGFHFYSSALKYKTPVYFQHNKIGTAFSNPAYAGGSSGPCVGCHMKNNRSHYYLPVVETDGVITAIPSDEQVCSRCHNSSNPHSAPWTAATLGEKKEGLKAALAALQQLVLRPGQDPANALGTYKAATDSISYGKTQWTSAFGSGIVPGSGSPLAAGAADSVTAGAYTMGAAFNYEMLLGDPGAYAHNSLYVRRLIFDSIDWLYDGAMNQNTKTALDYLKNNGFITSGSAGSTYEMSLAYLCESNSDPSGSLGVRP